MMMASSYSADFALWVVIPLGVAVVLRNLYLWRKDPQQFSLRGVSRLKALSFGDKILFAVFTLTFLLWAILLLV